MERGMYIELALDAATKMPNDDTAGVSIAAILPVADTPAVSTCADRILMGGVDPLGIGTIQLAAHTTLHENNSVRLTVDGSAAAHVRIFRHDGSAWHSLGTPGSWTLRPADFHADNTVRLGLVVAMPEVAHMTADWRHFTLTADQRNAEKSIVASDTIPCRVAPFQLASSLDPVEQVLVVKNRLTTDFVPALGAVLTEIGVPLQVIEPDDDTLSDIWMQDTVEIGRYVVPGRNGPQQVVGVLTGLRGRHDGIDCKPLDRAARDHFSQQNAILINADPRPHTRWIDWYGNLEVSPPVTTSDGRKFPCGRVLVGKQHELTMHPDILRFLEAQSVQMPAVTVDTSWLEVGHVDEVVNFVPAPGRPGFRVLIPSPAKARAILTDVTQVDPGCRVFADTAVEATVEMLLNEVASSAENETIQQAIDHTRRMLCEELGIVEDDFFEMPVLFSEGQAVIPNCVNCLVVNGHVILPDPKGPLADDVDAFAAPMRAELAALGLTVHFIDNWEPYHVRAGEVHCGTNAVRDVGTKPWWDLC